MTRLNKYTTIKKRGKAMKLLTDEEILQARLNRKDTRGFAVDDSERIRIERRIAQAQLESCECEAETQLKAETREINYLWLDALSACGITFDSEEEGFAVGHTLHLNRDFNWQNFKNNLAGIPPKSDLKAELRKVKEEIEEDVIEPIVNFYITNKDKQESAFELWRTCKKILEREGD